MNIPANYLRCMNRPKTPQSPSTNPQQPAILAPVEPVETVLTATATIETAKGQESPNRSILAIDPGTTESAFVVWDGTLLDSGFVPNEVLREFFRARLSFLEADEVAIEMIACYGMPVGKETFETCLWIGRFCERSRIEPRLVYRKDIKIHLCGSMKAKDGNIRQALIDKHGQRGTKKQPGPTYGLSKHLWAAMAVASYAADVPA